MDRFQSFSSPQSNSALVVDLNVFLLASVGSCTTCSSTGIQSTSSPSSASPIALACDVVHVGFSVLHTSCALHQTNLLIAVSDVLYLNNSATFTLFVGSSWIPTCQIQSGTSCSRILFWQFLRTCRGTCSQDTSGSPARFCSVTGSPAPSSKENPLSRRHQKRNSTTLERPRHHEPS